MHAVSHSLAHRGTPAARARARWQPYLSNSNPIAFLHTPASPTLPSPPRDQPRGVQPELQLRKPNQKYVVGLVDQAVKSLSEIWQPHDIPPVFMSASRPSFPTTPISNRTSQLPSPPLSPVLPTLLPQQASPSNLVPLKGFVHEVLRRSRTSGSVLQTALCYIEAVRAHVPALAEREKNGEGVRGEVDDSNRIEYAPTEDAEPTPAPPKLPPLPPLPSPLLCPRRTFLASLILASKFTQDRTFSNRAWAKLSGLPPREIGRCERALGDALQWRLWVGKVPTTRSQSEGAIAVEPPPVRTLRRFATEPMLGSESMCESPSPVPPNVARASTYYASPSELTPTPPTPPLSFSPASTVSSDGDRTLQLPNFLEDPVPMGTGYEQVKGSFEAARYGYPQPFVYEAPSGDSGMGSVCTHWMT
ncbi:hypothetical protein PLICRDRAFT_51214 [Plicaturopsis crispa FD-325 SS-3]|nr:hypothetical protein PLICRDRAFT_51214 [Plicaturopsis crispa FD-325 SS-3]